ncbi:MAG: xanthine dehydrogenase family protein subunit M [Pseudomonadota bacterium]
MPETNYVSPAKVEDAVAALAAANGDARILAGGTDLIVQMRSGSVRPRLIVDIKRIDETRQITAKDGAFTIGAAVTGAELSASSDFRDAWPGIVEAMDLIGSQQIQGRASPGGNLCNASPAADSAPALIAAGAVCNIAGPGGRRAIPAEEMVLAPGRTALETGEFLVSFDIPKPAPRTGDAYLRLIPRTEMDIAVVGAAVCLSVDDGGVCKAAKVVLGAVAPTQVIVPDGAAALVGTSLDETALEKLATAASAACDPVNDKRGTIEYRKKVAGVLARRAAVKAMGRATARS